MVTHPTVNYTTVWDILNSVCDNMINNSFLGYCDPGWLTDKLCKLILCKQCFKLLGMAIGRGKQVTICIPNYNRFFVLFVNSIDKWFKFLEDIKGYIRKIDCCDEERSKVTKFNLNWEGLKSVMHQVQTDCIVGWYAFMDVKCNTTTPFISILRTTSYPSIWISV